MPLSFPLRVFFPIPENRLLSCPLHKSDKYVPQKSHKDLPLRALTHSETAHTERLEAEITAQAAYPLLPNWATVADLGILVSTMRWFLFTSKTLGKSISSSQIRSNPLAVIQVHLKSMIILEEKWILWLLSPDTTTALTVITSSMLPNFPSVYYLQRAKLLVI